MIRVGVVGVGVMGYHHARVYSALEGCDLVGVTISMSNDRRRRRLPLRAALSGVKRGCSTR